MIEKSEEKQKFLLQVYRNLLNGLKTASERYGYKLSIDIQLDIEYIITTSSLQIVQQNKRNQDIFFGQHSDQNKLHGIAMLIQDQQVFMGQFKDGAQNGFGVLSLQNGQVAIGCFNQSEINGVQLDFHNNIIMQGKFLYDYQLTFISGSVMLENCQFIGNFKNGVGTGIMQGDTKAIKLYKQYLVLDGNFNDYASGTGEIYDLEQNIKYTGSFCQWRLYGNGSITYSNGQYVEGKFNANCPYVGELSQYGTGTVRILYDDGTANGDINEGIFQQGSLLENNYYFHGVMDQTHEKYDGVVINEYGQLLKQFISVSYPDGSLYPLAMKQKYGFVKIDSSQFAGYIIQNSDDYEIHGRMMQQSGLQQKGVFKYLELRGHSKTKYTSGRVTQGESNRDNIEILAQSKDYMMNDKNDILKQIDLKENYHICRNRSNDSVGFAIMICNNGDVIDGNQQYGKFYGLVNVIQADDIDVEGYANSTEQCCNALELSGVAQISIKKENVLKIIYQLGNRCFGNFDEYGNGEGLIITHDNIVKAGQFKKGKMFGKGSVKFQNGFEVIGIFFDDRVCEGNIDEYGNGCGTIHDMNGDVRTGQFLKGSLINGQFIRVCGQVYEGEFINNKFFKGVIRYPNGRSIQLE